MCTPARRLSRYRSLGFFQPGPTALRFEPVTTSPTDAHRPAHQCSPRGKGAPSRHVPFGVFAPELAPTRCTAKGRRAAHRSGLRLSPRARKCLPGSIPSRFTTGLEARLCISAKATTGSPGRCFGGSGLDGPERPAADQVGRTFDRCTGRADRRRRRGSRRQHGPGVSTASNADPVVRFPCTCLLDTSVECCAKGGTREQARPRRDGSVRSAMPHGPGSPTAAHIEMLARCSRVCAACSR